MDRVIKGVVCWFLNARVRWRLKRNWVPVLSMSRSEVEADQASRLKRLLIHAANHVPYYGNRLRELGVEDVGVLPKLPVLTKDIIRAAGTEMIADTFSDKQLIEKSTGGSTGEPLVFYRHREYLDASRMGTYRNMTLCGWQPGDPVANFWGINDPTAFKKRALKEELKMGFHTFNAFDAGAHVFGEWEERLESIKPVALYGYASTIWLFCKWMRERREGRGCKSDVLSAKPYALSSVWVRKLKGVFLTAEKLHGFQRELIEEVLGVPVFNLYGSTEIQNIAFACSKGNMHVATDFVVVEVDAPASEVGDFLLTSLHNYAMPFIRYRNGDRGRMLGYICDCGIEMPCISLDISRSCDNFRTKSGRVIHGEFFTHVMEGIQGVQKFQFKQTSLEKVELRVVGSAERRAESVGIAERRAESVGSAERRAESLERRAESLERRGGSGERRAESSESLQSNLMSVDKIPGIVAEKTGGELEVEVMWVDEIPLTSRGKHLFTISEIEAPEA